jgi:DNA-3-methyladenine glycosylase II
LPFATKIWLVSIETYGAPAPATYTDRLQARKLFTGVGSGKSLVMRYLDRNDLHDLSDDAARKFLIAFKGIGVWTADIYLLSALRRPDIWPVSDLALAVAVQEVKGLRSRPSPERHEKLSHLWRPHRATAARLFWQPTFQNVAKTALPSVCSSP